VIVLRQVKGVGVHDLGDGNMGTRNTFRTLGLGPGLAVALADGEQGRAERVDCPLAGFQPLLAGFRRGDGSPRARLPDLREIPRRQGLWLR